VPLALANNSEIASQFSTFSKTLLGHQDEVEEPVQKRRAFLGLL
jgi:hypothetical protein